MLGPLSKFCSILDFFLCYLERKVKRILERPYRFFHFDDHPRNLDLHLHASSLFVFCSEAAGPQSFGRQLSQDAQSHGLSRKLLFRNMGQKGQASPTPHGFH